MRRIFDLLVAVPAALLALPLALIALALLLPALGRPLLFTQQRSGRDGRPFRLLKLRTMRDPLPGADPLAGDAARTPPVGRLVRRLRIDEIPQLLNVIVGDMGVIGPRPLLPETIAAMGIDGQLRGRIPPGLTGWAQVHGGPELSDADKLALDCWYVEHRTPMLDVEILVRTIGVIIFGDKVHGQAVEHAHAGRHRRGG